MDSAFWSQGSHGTYEPKHPDNPKINVTKRQKLRNIVGVLFSYSINLKCEEEGKKWTGLMNTMPQSDNPIFKAKAKSLYPECCYLFKKKTLIAGFSPCTVKKLLK